MERSSFLHTVLNETVVATKTSDTCHIENYANVAWMLVADNTTPAPAGFNSTSSLNLTNNTITITEPNFATGLKVRLGTNGTLPAPFQTGTDYYIIAVTSLIVKIAETYAEAIAGTALDITNAGSGTHAISPVTLSSSVQPQLSVDGVNWQASGSAITISADTTTGALISGNSWQYMRCVITQTGGQVGFKFLIRGQK